MVYLVPLSTKVWNWFLIGYLRKLTTDGFTYILL